MVQLQMPAERFNSVKRKSLKRNQLDALHSFLSVCCDAVLKSIR